VCPGVASAWPGSWSITGRAGLIGSARRARTHVCGFQQVSLGIADSRNSRRHLGNVVTLLTPRASAATHQLYQRDALLDGIWLWRAHADRSELEQACEVGRTVLEWLPHIDSPRGLALLRRLTGELRARKANSDVREFSTELDCTLQMVA
jgi:hypothetical protein